MAEKLAEMYVEIQTDQRKLKTQMARLEGDFKRGGAKLGKAFSMGWAKVGGVLGIILAVKKAWDFSKEAKNFARDAQEISNKFDVVFSSIKNEANSMADEVSESFKLASSTARKLLGDAGDIFVGFGFGEKQALELSKRVVTLSQDLASFTNFEGGAERAAQALTKAVLGETESAKALGIVLRQDTKEFNEQVQALKKAEGQTETQARATVLLNEAYRQSAKALGDFKRTSGSLANVERIRAEQQKSFMEQIGQKAIPTFSALNEMLIQLLESTENNSGVMSAFGVVVQSLGTGVAILVGGLKGVVDGLVAVYEMSVAIVTSDYAGFIVAQQKLAKGWENAWTQSIGTIDKIWGEFKKDVIDTPTPTTSGSTSGAKPRDTRLSPWFYENRDKNKGADFQPITPQQIPVELKGIADDYFRIYEAMKDPSYLKEHKNLWVDIGEAQAVAMGSLISNWSQAIQLFSKANSMLQQFINTLAQVALQQAAFAAVDFVFGGITSLVSGLFKGGGNVVSQSLPKIAGATAATNQNALQKSAAPIIINTELDSLRFTQKKIVTSEKRLERGQKFGN